MLLNFKILSIASALIALLLGLVLLLVPGLLFNLFSVTANEAAFFMGRRTAILFLGVSVLSWLVKDAEPSLTRSAISMCFIVTMFGLAVLGAVELARGYAGPGIGLAVVTELALGVLYLKQWLRDQKVLDS